MKKRGNSQTFNFRWILVVSLLPLLAAWFLIPKDLEMAERLAHDGHPHRSLSLLKELIPREIGDSVNDGRGEWEYPAMSALLTDDGAARKRGGKKTRMLRILVQVSDEPEKVFSLFQAHPESLHSNVAKDLLHIVSTTALRQNKPKLASDIYHYLDNQYGMDDELLMNAIQAHRYSGSPRLALELLYSQSEGEGDDISGMSKENRMLIISLHRELNEGPRAFALLKDEFENTRTEAERQELVQLLATTATQSNMFEQSLPILEDHLSKTEAATLSWEELAARTEPHPTDEDFVRYGTTMAQQFLWSGKLHPAFDMYRKLALFDSGKHLETCVLMTPWVNRGNDLGGLLGAIDPLPKGKGYEKLYIDSLSKGGEFAKAESIVARWISNGHEDKSSLLLTQADLVFEQRRYKESQTFYHEALKAAKEEGQTMEELFPGIVRLAQVATINKDYTTALTHYRSIPEKLHTLKTSNDYLYLANSLTATDDIIKGLEIQISRFGVKGDSQPWLNMSTACEDAGRYQEAGKILQIGREACPKSKKIVLRIVENLEKQSRKQDAFESIVANYIPEDHRFKAKLLSLAVSTKREDDVLGFLGLQNSLAKDWPMTLRISLADLYESKMDFPKALALYDDIDPRGFTLQKSRISAQVAYKEGKIEEAWELYSAYLKLKSTPSYHDLIFMGDLHRFTGRTYEANFAYTAALRRLNSTFRPASTTAKQSSRL